MKSPPPFSGAAGCHTHTHPYIPCPCPFRSPGCLPVVCLTHTGRLRYAADGGQAVKPLVLHAVPLKCLGRRGSNRTSSAGTRAKHLATGVCLRMHTS